MLYLKSHFHFLSVKIVCLLVLSSMLMNYKSFKSHQCVAEHFKAIKLVILIFEKLSSRS